MSECFWLDRFGVTEDCGEGGGSDTRPGVYLYVLWGGLFGSPVEVRKYLIYDIDGRIRPVDPIGVRVAGSGSQGTDPTSLNRPTGMAARLEADGKVHIYVGEYTGWSEWVEGELERRSFQTSPAGYRVTSVGFDHNGQLVLGVSNFSEQPRNPPTFSSNWLVNGGGTPLGFGDGRWATSQYDLRSLNGICGFAFQKDGAAWVHDMASTNMPPLYRGRIAKFPAPYTDSVTPFVEVFPGSVNDYRELSGQIQIVDFGVGPDNTLEYLFFCHSPRQEDSPYEVEINIKSLFIQGGQVSVEVPIGIWGGAGQPYNTMAGMAVANFNLDLSPGPVGSSGPTRTYLMAAMQRSDQRYDIIFGDISSGPAGSYEVLIPAQHGAFPGQMAVVVIPDTSTPPPA